MNTVAQAVAWLDQTDPTWADKIIPPVAQLDYDERLMGAWVVCAMLPYVHFRGLLAKSLAANAYDTTGFWLCA